MELMKNGLAKPAVLRINKALAEIVPEFNSKAFAKEAMTGLEPLELKERVKHLIAVLNRHLPDSFPQTAKLLQQIPKVWDHGDADDPLRYFAAWPLTDYVAVYGLKHPKHSLKTMEKLTELFSSEFAIRPFILEYPEMCFEHFERWLNHPNDHIRRLVSEGTRPRLPWGMQLKPFINDPAPTLPLLEALKDDESLYVRRSVANHLNDIAKDNPDVVVDLCTRWYPNANEELRWVIRHATRTLVKAGRPEVFPLLGYTARPKFAEARISLQDKKVIFGEALNFDLELQSQSKRSQKVVVDFAIHFLKANGSHSAKVFKLKSLTCKPDENITLSKSHPIKPITTRKYYPGEHRLEVMINGAVVAGADFELVF